MSHTKAEPSYTTVEESPLGKLLFNLQKSLESALKDQGLQSHNTPEVNKTKEQIQALLNLIDEIKKILKAFDNGGTIGLTDVTKIKNAKALDKILEKYATPALKDLKTLDSKDFKKQVESAIKKLKKPLTEQSVKNAVKEVVVAIFNRPDSADSNPVLSHLLFIIHSFDLSDVLEDDKLANLINDSLFIKIKEEFLPGSELHKYYNFEIQHPILLSIVIDLLNQIDTLPIKFEDFATFLNPDAFKWVPKVNHAPKENQPYVYKISESEINVHERYEEYKRYIKSFLERSISDFFTKYPKNKQVEQENAKSELVKQAIQLLIKEIKTKSEGIANQLRELRKLTEEEPEKQVECILEKQKQVEVLANQLALLSKECVEFIRERKDCILGQIVSTDEESQKLLEVYEAEFQDDSLAGEKLFNIKYFKENNRGIMQQRIAADEVVRELNNIPTEVDGTLSRTRSILKSQLNEAISSWYQQELKAHTERLTGLRAQSKEVKDKADKLGEGLELDLASFSTPEEKIDHIKAKLVELERAKQEQLVALTNLFDHQKAAFTHLSEQRSIPEQLIEHAPKIREAINEQYRIADEGLGEAEQSIRAAKERLNKIELYLTTQLKQAEERASNNPEDFKKKIEEKRVEFSKTLHRDKEIPVELEDKTKLRTKYEDDVAAGLQLYKKQFKAFNEKLVEFTQKLAIIYKVDLKTISDGESEPIPQQVKNRIKEALRAKKQSLPIITNFQKFLEEMGRLNRNIASGKKLDNEVVVSFIKDIFTPDLADIVQPFLNGLMDAIGQKRILFKDVVSNPKHFYQILLGVHKESKAQAEKLNQFLDKRLDELTHYLTEYAQLTGLLESLEEIGAQLIGAETQYYNAKAIYDDHYLGAGEAIDRLNQELKDNARSRVELSEVMRTLEKIKKLLEGYHTLANQVREIEARQDRPLNQWLITAGKISQFSREITTLLEQREELAKQITATTNPNKEEYIEKAEQLKILFSSLKKDLEEGSNVCQEKIKEAVVQVNEFYERLKENYESYSSMYEEYKKYKNEATLNEEITFIQQVESLNAAFKAFKKVQENIPISDFDKQQIGIKATKEEIEKLVDSCRDALSIVPSTKLQACVRQLSFAENDAIEAITILTVADENKDIERDVQKVKRAATQIRSALAVKKEIDKMLLDYEEQGYKVTKPTRMFTDNAPPEQVTLTEFSGSVNSKIDEAKEAIKTASSDIISAKQEQLVEKYLSELDIYLNQRAERFSVKDKIPLLSSDKNNRENWVNNTLKVALNNYREDGNSDTLLEAIQQQNFPGVHLQPLLNRLILDVKELKKLSESLQGQLDPEPKPIITEPQEVTARHRQAKEIVNALDKKLKERLQAVYAGIDDMAKYGASVDKEGDKAAGETAQDLAATLRARLDEFIIQNKDDIKNRLLPPQKSAEFSKNFKICAHSQDDKMSQHRAKGKLIFANIVLGVVLAVKLLVDACTNKVKKPFFWQTERQKKVEDVEKSFDEAIQNLSAPAQK
ncbi:hypothetical protein ACQUW5_01960 [Legionella sp. CNM-1927-20]|uniref:hypothetical protein n=1 Tax=Legionella sp. CNM-1927-20 TaxID=3422221 RepID=UPI00403ABAAB